jgi:hypothetical protein
MEEDYLLDVRREQRQVHDLSHPRPGDETQAGQVGVVLHLAAVDHLLELDRQRHQTGDARDARRRWRGCLLRPACGLARRPFERDLVFAAVFHLVSSLQNSRMPFEL